MFSNHVDTAFSMLGDVRANDAFRLDKETPTTRERYGDGKFGQSLLLARRLVEAGVSLVTVNWDDETPQRQGLAVLGHAQPQLRVAQRLG